MRQDNRTSLLRQSFPKLCNQEYGVWMPKLSQCVGLTEGCGLEGSRDQCCWALGHERRHAWMQTTNRYLVRNIIMDSRSWPMDAKKIASNTHLLSIKINIKVNCKASICPNLQSAWSLSQSIFYTSSYLLYWVDWTKWLLMESVEQCDVRGADVNQQFLTPEAIPMGHGVW